MVSSPVQLADEHFRLALEAAPTGMLLIDDGGTIVLANAYVLRLFGYGKEELIGQKIELLVPQRFVRHTEFRRAYGDAPSARLMGVGRDLFGRRKDGSEVPVEIGLNPMPIGGRVFVLSSLIDITERLREAEQLRSALEAKEMLLREVHHRVKNNLQVISSLLNLQVASVGDSPAAKVLRETQNRVHSISLVHDLLQLSTEPARIDVCEYFAALTSHVAASWGTGVNLSLEVQEGLQLPLESAVPCGLIVNELLTNSLKHAFPSGKGCIVVSASQDGDQVELAVRDDGIGMVEHATPGLGLELLETLSRQLDSKLELSRAGGTTGRVRFRPPGA
jgi:PAS domain S-box-containing protein